MDWKVENVNVPMFQWSSVSINKQGCQTEIPTQYQNRTHKRDWKMFKLKWVNK